MGIRVKIAIIGECMIELSGKDGALRQGFGGDTLNTAIYLSRLMESDFAEVSYVTGLGRDPFSTAMLKQWADEGISTRYVIQMESHIPGMYYIETSQEGERHFYYWRGESAARFWLNTQQGKQVCETLADFDVIYLSGISLAILDADSRDRLLKVLSLCRAKGGRVFFDNNFRPRLWSSQAEARQTYQRMLDITDTAFLTLDDEEALWGTASLTELHKRCVRAGVTEVVIKRGQKSCIVMQDTKTWEIPAVQLSPEYVKDTTAAGDSFSAGYLACRLAGGDAETSARQGHQLASRVIQHYGAIIPANLMPVNF